MPSSWTLDFLAPAPRPAQFQTGILVIDVHQGNINPGGAGHAPLSVPKVARLRPGRNRACAELRWSCALASPCGPARASLKPEGLVFRESPMTAILTILVFLVVIFAINIYEFGRPD